MTSAFSWQNSVSLCPASFCTRRPNLPATPSISWLSCIGSFCSFKAVLSNCIFQSIRFPPSMVQVRAAAAAAAKSLQSCPTLWDPIDCWEPAYCILSAALSTASSFRIWNSSTRILSLLGASLRHSAHGKGHEEGGSAHAKAGSSLRSPPGNSRASTPKPESAYFLLCALTYTSDFMGAVPHYLSLKKELAYSSS